MDPLTEESAEKEQKGSGIESFDGLAAGCHKNLWNAVHRGSNGLIHGFRSGSAERDRKASLFRSPEPDPRRVRQKGTHPSTIGLCDGGALNKLESEVAPQLLVYS